MPLRGREPRRATAAAGRRLTTTVERLDAQHCTARSLSAIPYSSAENRAAPRTPVRGSWRSPTRVALAVGFCMAQAMPDGAPEAGRPAIPA